MTFQRVENFKYVGGILNEDNHQTDVQERVKNATETYFIQQFFSDKTISKKLKARLKNTIVNKALTYA
jgi:hypothetical protein